MADGMIPGVDSAKQYLKRYQRPSYLFKERTRSSCLSPLSVICNEISGTEIPLDNNWYAVFCRQKWLRKSRSRRWNMDAKIMGHCAAAGGAWLIAGRTARYEQSFNLKRIL
jgi:hypothetical protein